MGGHRCTFYQSKPNQRNGAFIKIKDKVIAKYVAYTSIKITLDLM